VSGPARPRTSIRPQRPGDHVWTLRLRLENVDFLAPYEPTRPPEFLTAEGQRRYVESAVHADGAAPFAVLADGEPVGVINVSNIVRGPFASGNVGYWVAEPWNGLGVATAALGLLVEHAFGPLRLHRLEAGTLVHNVASQRVLRRNGFLPIGVSRRYLHIGGAWRDHLLFARTADDVESPGADGPSRPKAVVREARPADAAALVALLASAAEEPDAALGPVGSVRDERRRLADAARSADAVVLAADQGGTLVGRLDVQRDAHPRARHVAEVGLVVAAGMRRHGLGRTLLTAAEAWARRAGVTKLEAHVALANVPALRLLDRCGWIAEGLRSGHLSGAAGPVDVLLMARAIDAPG